MTITNSPILGRMLRPLAQTMRTELLEAVVALKPSSGDEDRYHELAEKNAEGQITDEERQELEGIVSANTVLSLLRKEARQTLSKR